MSMPKMTRQEYINAAKSYLEPIKLIDLEIKSAQAELRRLEGDITSLSAIDYSKERISGGGSPTGLENGVARLLEKEAKSRDKIGQLTTRLCNASDLIDKLTNQMGRIILKQEYIVGLTTKGALGFSEIGETNAKKCRLDALAEFGYNLTKNDRE